MNHQPFPLPVGLSKINRPIGPRRSTLRFFTRQQHGHRTSETPAFSKTPIFTLLLPYFHPTFTLPHNRHHRFRRLTRPFRLNSSVAKTGTGVLNQSRAARFFKSRCFHPGFTLDSPRICPASRVEVRQGGAPTLAADPFPNHEK